MGRKTTSLLYIGCMRMDACHKSTTGAQGCYMGSVPTQIFLVPSRNVPLRSRPQLVTLTLGVRIFTTADVGAELDQI